MMVSHLLITLVALDFHDDYGDEFGDERDSDVAAASSTSHNITDWEVRGMYGWLL